MGDEAKKPMIQNAVDLDLGRVLVELDGKHQQIEEDGQKRPFTLRDYLCSAFNRVRQIDDMVTFFSLSSRIVQHANGVFRLEDANLKMVRAIVEKDAVRVLDRQGQKLADEPISPVTRGQVLAILDGKA